MFCKKSILVGILVSSLLGCASYETPVALLQRPERPQLSKTEDIRAAVHSEDMAALTKLYARDMAELTAYARKLEALLDAVERQEKK